MGFKICSESDELFGNKKKNDDIMAGGHNPWDESDDHSRQEAHTGGGEVCKWILIALFVSSGIDKGADFIFSFFK